MWKRLFEQNLEQQKNCDHKVLAETAYYMQLASLDRRTETGEWIPSCRTMCFRKLIGDRYLAFSMDKRSHKIETELKHSQWVELCSYFPLTKQQFRFRGKAFSVGPSLGESCLPPSPSPSSSSASSPSSSIDWFKERLLLYQHHTSDFMRANFAWECHPGHKRDRYLERSSQPSDIEYRLHGDYTRPFLRQLRDYTSEEVLSQSDLFISEEERCSEMIYHDRALSNFFMLIVQVDSVDHINLGTFPFERHLYRKPDERQQQQQGDSDISTSQEMVCIDVYP
jgi:hypothetical protein